MNLSQLRDLKETWYVTRATALSCITFHKLINTYEGLNFNSGNYLFTTDTK